MEEGVTKKPNIEKAKPIVRWGRKATGLQDFWILGFMIDF
jgi:hypothetical protein